MSVLIEDMEMPDKCGHCRFATALECQVTKNFITTFNVKQIDCPLVPVPEPHGRLIDADKLCLSSGFSTETEYGMGRSDQIEAIKSNAPTVIPASKEAE